MIIRAVLIFTCLLGSSLQADSREELSGALCAEGPGLWPSPADCAGFVLCVGGSGGNATVGRLLRCPPGTAFSQQLRTCVPYNQVESCREQADEESTHSVHIRVPSRQRRAEELELPETEGDCEDGVLGATCADCDRLVVCAQVNGRISPVTSVSCSSLEGSNTCSTTEKNCVADGPPCNVAPQPLPFRCLEPGIFPDPEDCTRYHLCGADLGHISDTCTDQYDPESKSCLDAPKEPTTRPPCGETLDCTKLPGGVLALAHAPAYYALCVPSVTSATASTNAKITYHKSVLGCPEGELFDDKTRKCRRSCGSRRGRLPVKGDCRAYIECSSARAQPRRHRCSQGFAFDPSRRMCLPESQVAACSQQESNTSPPRITHQASTTTSQMKQVPSSLIQTTPMTPVVNILVPQYPVCSSEGRFIDHLDCRRYKHCWQTWDGALTMTVRWCPLFTYFDPTTSTCRIGFC